MPSFVALPAMAMAIPIPKRIARVIQLVIQCFRYFIFFQLGVLACACLPESCPQLCPTLACNALWLPRCVAVIVVVVVVCLGR